MALFATSQLAGVGGWEYEVATRRVFTGRVVSYQAESEDEMQAVADALSLLANLVMG